jgi:hypothetical protein
MTSSAATRHIGTYQLFAGAAATFEEERREVLEGIFEALAAEDCEPESRAACEALLRHLAGFPRVGRPN